MSKYFFDTNVLLYSIDREGEPKRTAARAMIRRVRDGETQGVISTQVMQEFAAISVRKLKSDPAVVREFLNSLDDFEIVTILPEMVIGAVELQSSAKISFWDALILVAAESSRCEMLYTEDLNHGQKIRGVRIENPFKDC